MSRLGRNREDSPLLTGIKVMGSVTEDGKTIAILVFTNIHGEQVGMQLDTDTVLDLQRQLAAFSYQVHREQS